MTTTTPRTTKRRTPSSPPPAMPINLPTPATHDGSIATQRSPLGQRKLSSVPQRRLSAMAFGFVFILAGALVTVFLVSASSTRTTVLVAARNLPAGEPITAADLRSVAINADEAVSYTPAGRADSLVDRVPLAPLSAGTLLNPAMFATSSDLSDGDTVIAASMQPGEVPTNRLGHGDRVAAILVPSGSTGVEPARLLGVGTVYDLAQEKGDPDVVVSLRVPLEQGAPIASAAAQKRLRLMLVPPDLSADKIAEIVAANTDQTPTTGTDTNTSTTVKSSTTAKAAGG